MLGLVVGSGVGSPREAHADEKGDKALAAVDEAIFNKAKTQYIEYDAAINVKDKPSRAVKLAVYMKAEKRFSEFLAPSDVKGTKVLILSPSQMYVYLPAFKKVRRIASHVTDQGFMGMNFAQDEMSITSYTKMYSATLVSDDGKIVKLALKAKEGAEAPYAKIDMVVEKSRMVPTELKYYSDTGAHVKTRDARGLHDGQGSDQPEDAQDGRSHEGRCQHRAHAREVEGQRRHPGLALHQARARRRLLIAAPRWDRPGRLRAARPSSFSWRAPRPRSASARARSA